MLSGAPQMWGQAVDTINYKWAKSIGGTVADAKFHPITGNILAAVNGEIWEIDHNTGETIRVFDKAEGAIGGLFTSFDGTKIIANGKYLYDYQSGRKERTLKGRASATTDYSYGYWFPDNIRLLGTTDSCYSISVPPWNTCDINLVIYDVGLDTIIASYNPNDFFLPGSYVHLARMSLSPDGKYIAMVFKNKVESYWYPILVSVDSMKAVKDGYFWMNDNESIGLEPTDIKWSKDSKYVGLRYGNGKLSIFDVAEWINSKWQSGKYSYLGFSVESFDFASDRDNIVLEGSHNNRQGIRLVNLFSKDIRYYFPSYGYIKTGNNNNFIDYGGGGLSYWEYSPVNVKESYKLFSPIKSILYNRGTLIISISTEEIIADITIFDINGKMLYKDKQEFIKNGIIEISIPLSVGTYFITMQIGKSMYNEKLLVEGK